MNKQSIRLKNLKINKKRKKEKREITVDRKGILFISDIFVLLIMSILVISTIIIVMDLSNEKILDSVERSNLERKTMKTIDNLIKNPGSPDDWDYQENKGSIIPGLAGENKTVSFNKILSLKKSYKKLVEDKIFQNEIKSSITIYPLSSELSPMEFGDNENLQYAGNVVSVKRLVKCDFLSRFKVLDFKDDKKDLCINPNYKTWICKPFLLTRKDLEHNDYYLLFNNKIINSYWSISNPNNINEKEYLINTNVYRLNSILENQMKNSLQMNFWIHIKLDENKNDNLNTCLVAIPREFNINEILPNGLKFEYFQYNDCYLTLKTWH
ncbi:MAG: hypothetical protein LBR15_04355 [Methanobrevibacter sp.]|nr:hypothetical protein [Candidatus Methanovirga australis]